MNRCALLSLAPAALSSAAAPAAALGVVDPTDTPVMRLFREWELAIDAYRAAEATDPLGTLTVQTYEAQGDLERSILETPCLTARDFTAKVIAWTDCGEHDLPDRAENQTLWAEARALIGAAQ